MHIHAIASADNGRVFLTEHAEIRNPKAAKYPLTKPQIVRVLQAGQIDEGPTQDLVIANRWKFSMTRMFDGHTYCVSGVLVPKTMILVIAGFEDRKKRLLRAPRRPSGIGGDGSDTE